MYPSDTATLLEAGQTAITLPDFAMAEKFFRMALSVTSDPGSVHNELGKIYLQQDKPQQAIDEYTAVLAQSPQHPDAIANLGLAYLKTKDFDKAITYLHKAAQMQPQNADRQNMLGLAYIQSNHLDDAIKTFKRAVSLKPDSIVYHYNLGEAYRLSGLQEQAVSEYDSALQNTPETADEFFNQGKVGYRMGLYEDAIKKYTVALERFTEPVAKAQVYMGLGMAYEALEKNALARQMFEQYLKIVPSGDSAQLVRNRLKVLQ